MVSVEEKDEQVHHIAWVQFPTATRRGEIEIKTVSFRGMHLANTIRSIILWGEDTRHVNHFLHLVCVVHSVFELCCKKRFEFGCVLAEVEQRFSDNRNFKLMRMLQYIE